MEDLWKKFKEETQQHMQKINDFLNETSPDEKSQPIEIEKQVINLENEKSHQTAWIEKYPNEISNKTEINEQVQQVVLENNETTKIKRKEIYGKMRDLVKEIMERENVSRAQAYRRAKKRFLENSR